MLDRYVKDSHRYKIPMNIMFIGKQLYFLILVDDCSGQIAAYPIQKKSDALKWCRGFAEQAWSKPGKESTI
jgi:hypothetical protein